ncbi:hypothetical protein C0Q70_02000 [Pomacea canaliculata]|uniref:Uncharacterized protein n=1 Tax=Pomacea canaliculata TaxID=400727 RepID=A0A2T7Q153_POMCA|nr:hypothetical protein C0Q70_02000 [Pomacea canaliculata]
MLTCTYDRHAPLHDVPLHGCYQRQATKAPSWRCSAGRSRVVTCDTRGDYRCEGWVGEVGGTGGERGKERREGAGRVAPAVCGGRCTAGGDNGLNTRWRLPCQRLQQRAVRRCRPRTLPCTAHRRESNSKRAMRQERNLWDSIQCKTEPRAGGHDTSQDDGRSSSSCLLLSTCDQILNG